MPNVDIKAIVTDFDGVLTDNYAYVDNNAVESVKVSRSDGLGIKLLKNAGLTVLILSTEKNSVVSKRADKLKVECIQNTSDKEAVIREWSSKNSIPLNQICYIGNDLNDLSVMNIVGLPVAVSDSAIEILAVSKIVLSSNGGNHALRELAEIILNDKKETAGEKK
jgi:N-acylneuraminate cytidylyltransferase